MILSSELQREIYGIHRCGKVINSIKASDIIESIAVEKKTSPIYNKIINKVQIHVGFH